jgi:hypothetical protein
MKTCNLATAGRAAAFACTLSCLSFAATAAHAALGDAAAVPPSATTRNLASANAHVVSYLDASGATIHEYVANASGTVFAYTWEGPAQPSLDTLLGRYAPEWRSAAAALHAADRDDLHAARVDSANVVVETGGHMRAYVGRAWLPAALPAGLGEGDLQ